MISQSNGAAVWAGHDTSPKTVLGEPEVYASNRFGEEVGRFLLGVRRWCNDSVRETTIQLRIYNLGQVMTVLILTPLSSEKFTGLPDSPVAGTATNEFSNWMRSIIDLGGPRSTGFAPPMSSPAFQLRPSFPSGDETATPGHGFEFDRTRADYFPRRRPADTWTSRPGSAERSVDLAVRIATAELIGWNARTIAS